MAESKIKTKEIEFKKQLILEEAMKLIDKVGFKNAKMEDIAHKVGFSKASLYSYFRDKEEIAMQIIKLHLENFYKKISSLPEKNISAKEKLGFIKNGYMDFIRKAKNYIIIKSNMDCNDITHKEVIELKTNIYYVLSSILEQGIKEKTFIKSLNIPKSALLLESMLTGISFINSIADQSNDKTLSGFNIEEMTSFAMDFFYMGITNTKQELCK